MLSIARHSKGLKIVHIYAALFYMTREYFYPFVGLEINNNGVKIVSKILHFKNIGEPVSTWTASSIERLHTPSFKYSCNKQYLFQHLTKTPLSILSETKIVCRVRDILFVNLIPRSRLHVCWFYNCLHAICWAFEKYVKWNHVHPPRSREF